jgi:signal transduction histidine kinase
MGPGGNAVLRPLLGAWHNALIAHAARERLSHLNEELAEATRTLAEAQAALAKRDAMARLGEITAGAAHEINNPLTIISGRGQLLASRMRDVKDKTAAQQVVAAAQQVAQLVQDLHLFANPPSPQPRRCALGEIVSRAIARAGEVVGSPSTGIDAAKIDSVMGRAPQELVTDPNLFGAALVELITNALEACPKGPIMLRGDVEAGRLILRVIDAGQGLSAKAMEHAFDAFFSERAAGRGRGLGLTRAQAYARALRGEITLESRPGKGTTATLAIEAWRRFASSDAAHERTNFS